MEVLKELPLKFEPFDLGPSLGGSFLDLDFKGRDLEHYKQFSDEAEERFLRNSKGEILARAVFFTKDFHQKDRGKIKVLIVSNIRTVNSREALLGWSELLLPEILKFKIDTGSDYAMFYLSRRHRGLFDFFMRPRKVREDQIRFSHLRTASVHITQGVQFFAEDVLEHVRIRRASVSDMSNLEDFIKKGSLHSPVSRFIEEGSLRQEIKNWKGFDFDNLALAFDSNDQIVGSLGAYGISGQAECRFKFDEVQEPTFLALQTFLKLGSWVTDFRPVLEKQSQSIKFFTHMYFNNTDIFYTLARWWIRETKLDRSLFLHPYYQGDMIGAPSDSLYTSGFTGDLFLVQKEGDPPSDLLKPALFSNALDIDLPYFF